MTDNGKKAAKIKDVAAAAGVSVATVSRVLANKTFVRPELRMRVLEAAQALSYQPNQAARSLRSQTSNTIALLVSDIRNPFFTALSRAVEDACYLQGMSVFLGNTDEDPRREEMYLDLIRSERVAGLIYSPTRETAETFGELHLDIPTVVVDRAVSGADVDSVVIDNAGAAQQLTAHLLEHGYRRVAGIFGSASTTGQARYSGYMQALREHGITLAPQWATFASPRIEEGHAAAAKLLALPEPPDAIIGTNSLLTAGALMAIRERGLAIPTQIALAGFDDDTWTTLVEPPVTVVAQPTYEIGTTAAELLLQRLADPARSTRQVILKAQLVVRASTAPR
jgi:LacI family fructose operon transcriptional repressor